MNLHRKHMLRLLHLEKIAKAHVGFGNGSRGNGARIAAMIFHKNKPLSVGLNLPKTSPFQKKYGRNEDSIFIHAEIAAIKQAIDEFGVEDFIRMKTVLYVCRVKRPPSMPDGPIIWGLSKPCSGCLSAISEFRINQVIYTLNQDQVGEKAFEVVNL